MAGNAKGKNLLDALKASPDPFLRRLAEGEAWGNVMYEQEQWEASNEGKRQRETERLEAKRAEVSRWEGQLRAVMRGRQGPSAIRHKERLLQSLRNGYTELGQNPSNVNALVSRIQAEINAGTRGGGTRSTRRVVKRSTRRHRK